MAGIVESVALIGESGDRLDLSVGAPGAGGWVLGRASAGALEGWWAPPATRAEAVVRPQDDGAFSPLKLLAGARTITLVAHHISTSPSDELAARAQLARISRERLRLVVSEFGRTLHVRGFVSAQVRASHVADYASTWSLVITCPDPLKYEGPGEDAVGGFESWKSVSVVWSGDESGGLLFDLFDQSPREDVTTGDAGLLFSGSGTKSLTAVNSGTADTWPVLEVIGPVASASWKLGEQTVGWGGLVPENLLLRIDSRTGEISLGGVQVDQSELVMDDFFALSPGESTISLLADRSARFTVRWMNAWM